MRWPSIAARLETRLLLRWRRQREWHKWWAWHPVRLNGTTVWLEGIERKRHDGHIATYWTHR